MHTLHTMYSLIPGGACQEAGVLYVSSRSLKKSSTHYIPSTAWHQEELAKRLVFFTCLANHLQIKHTCTHYIPGIAWCLRELVGKPQILMCLADHPRSALLPRSQQSWAAGQFPLKWKGCKCVCVCVCVCAPTAGDCVHLLQVITQCSLLITSILITQCSLLITSLLIT